MTREEIQPVMGVVRIIGGIIRMVGITKIGALGMVRGGGVPPKSMPWTGGKNIEGQGLVVLCCTPTPSIFCAWGQGKVFGYHLPLTNHLCICLFEGQNRSRTQFFGCDSAGVLCRFKKFGCCTNFVVQMQVPKKQCH